MINNKTTDIVFVTPSYKPVLNQESLGTLILAKKAELANYLVKIIRFWEVNLDNYNDFRNSICNLILKNSPKVVSFYCRGAEYHILVDLSRLIKLYSPNTYIIFGGPQAELTAQDSLKCFKSIDFICCGEGENTIVPLLDLIVKHNADETIARTLPGLVYRNQFGNICKNPNPKFIADGYSHDYNYYNLIPEKLLLKSKDITIDVGRGCPFSCTFCSTKTFWKRNYRLRSAHDIIDEIQYVRHSFGEKIFSFSHDLFTANKSKVLNFCKLLQDGGINIKWSCSSRIDCINKYIIDQMASSGLVAIYFGIETGSSRMQKLINKNLDIQQCKDIVEYSIKKGIAVTASFIYGFPEETYNDLNDTLSVIHELMAIGANVQLHCLAFEVGSTLYKNYRSCLVFNKIKFATTFGGSNLSSLAEHHLEIFANYWEYPSELRECMRNLNVFHAICKEYPRFYLTILNIFHKKGYNYVDTYKFLLDLINDSLERIEKNKVQLSKSIAYFLILKIISKLTNASVENKFSLSDSEIEMIKSLM